MEKQNIYKALGEKYTTELNERDMNRIKAGSIIAQKAGFDVGSFEHSKMVAQHKAVLMDFAVASQLVEEETDTQDVEETPDTE